MNVSRYSLTFAVVLTLAAATQMHATVLFSEGFDSITPNTYVAPFTLGNFNLTSGSVDVAGGSYFGFLCVSPSVQHCTDLDGMAAGTLSSNPIAFTPGNYVLSFVLNGSQRPTPAGNASATVQLGSLLSQSFTLPYLYTGSQNLPFTVSTPQSATLTFTSTTPGATGLLLDSVSIATASDVAIPEPASWFLAGAASMLLLLMRRRRV